MLVILGYLVPIFLVLSVLQFFKLRKNASSHASGGVLKTVIASFVSVAAGMLGGCGVGYLVMFGPSHVTGDFIGLPWFTAIPAVLIGLALMTVLSNAVGRALVAGNDATGRSSAHQE
jgi:hypothetical protein